MIRLGRCKRCGAGIVAPCPSEVGHFMTLGYCSLACKRAADLDAEILKCEGMDSVRPTPELIEAVAKLRELCGL